jgi:cytidylate kinase
VNSPENGWVITLDGPAGSGKSTTAQQVAEVLEFVYLDTGALYRAITVLALTHGVAPDDHGAMEDLVASSGVQVRRQNDGQHVFTQDTDLTSRLRSAEVDRHVSAISAVPGVRQAMLDVQRAQRQMPGLVAEGRDLGTVVFPDAHLKIYLVADLEVRAKRRAIQRQAQGELASVEAEREALQKRDTYDSTREVAPLRQPDGSQVVDTTEVTIEQQVERVVELFRAGADL